MSIITKATAAEFLLQRRKIRENLVEWARYYGRFRNWEPATHHIFLLQTLQAATDGTLVHPETGDPCKNVMVLMPPGSAKSSYTSIIFPPWYLQRKPGSRILACSYAADLIESFSRECRNAVQEHYKVLGYELSPDSRAVQEWSTTNRGTYRCAGTTGGISGRRAYIGYIDDYIGSREDADSKLFRDKQWHWYWNDFWPRLISSAPQIIVANRQHEDDLVGRLLESQGKKWALLKLPFFAEDNDLIGRAVGEPLWPEWFDANKVEEIRDLRTIEPRTYAGLYQQRPAPEEGNYFKRNMLVPYTREELTKVLARQPRVYGAADWAVSEKKGSNKTCFGGAVEDYDGTIYILPDLFWKVAGPKEVLANFKHFLKSKNPLVTWSEKGHISQSWGPFLKEQMLEEEIYNYIVEVTPVKDKETRAQSIRGRMSLGKVRFPTFAPWWPEAIHELLTFPGGKSDDFVDFISHIGLGLGKITRAARQRDPDVEEIDSPPITIKWIKEQDKLQKNQNAPQYEGR